MWVSPRMSPTQSGARGEAHLRLGGDRQAEGRADNGVLLIRSKVTGGGLLWWTSVQGNDQGGTGGLRRSTSTKQRSSGGCASACRWRWVAMRAVA
jgi:hypothetical protein